MLKQAALAVPAIKRLYNDHARLARECNALTERLATVPELSLRVTQGTVQHPYADAVERALELALAGDGKLPPAILDLEGMSGRKYRRFINALIANISEPRYLEIGCYMGSTACAAIYGNGVVATLIDNWSEFGGPKEEFQRNIALASSRRTKLRIIEQDFRTTDPASIGSHNVYLFDGPHKEADQYDGVMRMQSALYDDYVLIVDDWNWPEVRKGTVRALADLKATVSLRVEIRTTRDDSCPYISQKNSDWHNGYFVACISKHEASIHISP
jgi:hypothetical protein